MISCSSSFWPWISFKRSRLIFASWSCWAKPIKEPMGPLSWPMIYVKDIIIPRVISPSTTDLAAIKEITIFVVWLKNTEPTCWTCPNASPFTLILKSFTWMRSHCQRFCFSQLFSLISCMAVTNWIKLLCSPAAWAKRRISSSRRYFMNTRIQQI